jgi:glycyl-tRNA synthetase
MSHNAKEATLEKIVSLCKRRGFIYQSAEIYGGLNGVYDTGHTGLLLKENLKSAWKKSVSLDDYTTLFMDGALLGHQEMWKASGHVGNFHDPMVDCLVCKKRYRTDDVDLSKSCPGCGNKKWTESRTFNLMFQTNLGAASDNAAIAYLRPETAQTVFVNFKNICTTNRVKIPFGIGQIGKAFRNEITPKQFLFRMREFEQMELEWFCKPETAPDFFELWLSERKKFYQHIGVNMDKIRFRPHEKDELSHYSSQTTDIEYEFPFGWKELEGIAHRGNFDLTEHAKHSGKELAIFDQATNSSFVPHVVECSVGVDRLFLTVLFDAYHEDVIENEERIVLRLSPKIAPIKGAFFPLTKPLFDKAETLFVRIKKETEIQMMYDESGSIGKRYRRADEIGIPFCFTYDFESESSQTVTIRYRDTLKQERIGFDAIGTFLAKETKL